MSGELTAVQIMQSDVRSVGSKMGIEEFENVLIRAGIGGAPVVDDGKLVGIISRSDIVRHLAGDFSAESIETDYYWDLGGSTSPRAIDGSARADAGAIEHSLADMTVGDLMVEEIISVVPESPVSLVAGLMARRHIHRVLVVEDSRLLGVITTMDLTRLLADGRAVAGA